MLGSVSGVDEVNTVVLGSVSAVGKVKIGSQVGIGRSLVVIKDISLSLMPPLAFFERALIIINTTTTHKTITITVIATIVPVALVAVFMEEVTVVVFVEIVEVVAVLMEEVMAFLVVVTFEIVEVVAEFMEEVMAFVVVVAAAVVEVDVHAANDIDPEEPVNM